MTGTLTVNANNNVITANNITTADEYAVKLSSKTGNNVTENYLVAATYKGDKAVDFTSETNIVKDNLPKAVILIFTDLVWIGSDANVIVNVPDAQGPVTVEINGKTYTVELMNGAGSVVVPAEDLENGVNIITATYAGPEFAPETVNATLFVGDGVITNSTYPYYFDANGYLFEYVPNDVTLDFQGLFLGKYPVYIDKCVNATSTTGDALFDCGDTYAGNNINSFNIIAGGDYTNITGLKFINYCLYIKGASNVVVDDISIVDFLPRVGASTGFLSIHTGAYNTTVKNSYFENGGTGSSLLVLGKGGAYVVFDHNVFNITGSSGNVISANQFVGSGDNPEHTTYTNNLIYNSQPASGFCYAMTVSGSGNLVENNTIYFNGSGILNQYGASSTGNVYRNNSIYGTATFVPSANSLVENNKVYSTGAVTINAGTTAINNTFIKATISGANVNFTGNTMTGTLTVNSNNNVITANNITTADAYAVDLKSTTGNNVTENYLIAAELKGDAAVNGDGDTNIIENNLPLSSNLVITVENITYGEDAIVNVEFNPKATGTIVVSIDGNDYEVEIISEGQGIATIPGLTPKDYDVTATFTSDDPDVLDSDANASFTVFKANVTMEAAADAVKVGDDVIVNVTFDKADATGDVTITIDGTDYTGTVEDGAATITIPGLAADEYTVDVVYSGDDNYNDTVASVSFDVDKYAVEFTKAKGHPGRVDKNATIDVILSESDATGTVSINIDGVDYSAELADGKAVIYAPLLPAGTYDVDVIYSGDDKYENNTAAATFNVNKYYPTMKATAESARMDENATVNVALPSDATGTVTITVDGVDYTADVVDGTAAVVLPVISEAGVHTFDVVYSGDDKYRPYTTTVDVNVLKYNANIKATARTVKLGNNVTVNVVLPSDATGEASIDINGTVYTGTVEDGAATIIISDLGVGQYALTVDYSGDDKYKPANTTVTFNVNKQTTSIKASARTVKVGDDVTVNVVLAEDATGEVIINVDGTDYTATVENGQATIVIPGLPYGQYALNVQYSGDDKYKARNTTVTFNVNKQSTTMKATARTVKVGDNVTVNVKLASDVTGEVIITVDGVDYTATVEDGVASIVLPDLPAGQYALEVKYGGDDKYKAQSTTVTFNVNKYNVKMRATATYYASGDYSVISVTLSDDATGTVSTEVNGNVYSTNVVDGSALIAIAKLPAGEYTLDIEYSGDAKYNNYTVTKTLNVVK